MVLPGSSAAPTGIIGNVPCFEPIHRAMRPITLTMVLEYFGPDVAEAVHRSAPPPLLPTTYLAEINMDFPRASAGPTSA
jgi:hypothetical protein